MKRDLLMSAAFVLALSANVYGGECNLEIRDGSVAQDVNKALLCLDQRLKNLETKSSSPEQRLSSGIPTRNPDTFDAGPFTVSVRAATRSGDRLHLGIQIYNKTAEPIFLAFSEASLIDEDTGVSIRFLGLDNGVVSLSYGMEKEERGYTLIPANTILNFSLQYESGQIKSNTLGLTLRLYSLKSQQPQRIAAPLGVTLKGK